MVYPLDGAMLSRNWGGMNLQWSAGDGNRLFRITLAGPSGSASIFAADDLCPAGRCALVLPDAFWLSIASANANARVQIRIDATPQRDGPVATGGPITIVFAPEEMSGDLLYWSSSVLGVVKVDSGETTPKIFVDPKTPPAPAPPRICVGCHSVSADGCLVAFSYQADYQYALGLAHPQGTTRSVSTLTTSDATSFSTVDREGRRVLTARAGVLTLRDRSGLKLLTVPKELVGPPGEDFATHPEWAPDGRSVVFVRAPVARAEQTSDWTESGDIAVLPFDGDQPGQARVLVPRTNQERHFYPHVSPDNRWVVFSSGRTPGSATRAAPSGGLSTYAQTTARLRMVALTGGAPIELARATHGAQVTASMPRFAPFVQRNGTLLFISFSIKLDYGWVLDQAAVARSTGKGRAQLWMAAIDLARSGDPSFAPFWLPAQSVNDFNYNAFWVPTGSSCPP